MKLLRPRRNRKRGSLLIVAMILCAIIGISLGSYIQLGRSSLEISNRALYNNAAMNLAENGLEEAMYALNKKVADPTYAWTGWSNSGGPNAWQSLPGTGSYAFEQGATGTVRVLVYGYQGNNPTAVARSTVTLGGGSGRTIEKWLEVQLRKTSKFANGLVARQQIRFTGTTASVDSWNSDPDNNPSTAALHYDSSIRRDHGSLASASVAVNSILLNNAQIWGFVATGGTVPAVGISGSIGPFGTPAGTVNSTHVATDFAANFDSVTTPSNAGYALGSITNNLNLPRTGDAAAADGKFYYTASEISFNNRTLSIEKRTVGDPAPKVVLILTNALDSIDVTGTGAINVETGARLELFAPGDIRLAGAGATNGGTTLATANQPIALQIWGTKTTGVQDIDLEGNGVLSALVYAPQGNVTINGSGHVLGSVVADTITIAHSVAFHYDESLENFGGNNPFRVAHWKELTTTASRTPHASGLSF